MNKGSKNNRENRGTGSVMRCAICGDERKPVRVMSLNRNLMGYECKCGLLTKSRTAIKM